jgi:hypothetical protein
MTNKPEMTDPDEAAVRELITKRMAAEDADSGWALAYTALLFLPVLKNIDNKLDVIRWVLGEDIVSQTGGSPSPRISAGIQEIAAYLKILAGKGKHGW